ncbi:hypothetical protein [Hoeflea poritis]|uniref:Uncharacterized protein n=1 Tax=Hoeflea poritis TaxID=2993659 RepID=A0ABT4VTD3_9HYPH|nr:hypothetical protein [Hoeflea poritis]MDA4847970.1 hypothetical protein [Hoeflea poritis]
MFSLEGHTAIVTGGASGDDACHVRGMGEKRRDRERAGTGAIETALVRKMHDEETRRACLALPQSSYITGVTPPA